MRRTEASPLLGREEETSWLVAAILARRSMLIHGPPDSGKTSLVEQAVAKLPPSVAGGCLRVDASGPLRHALEETVAALFAAGDLTIEAAYSARAENFRSAKSWARKQTGRLLSNLLFRAFDKSRYWIFWDNIGRLGPAHAHFLRETIRMRKTPVYVLARDCGEEILGHAARLYWSGEQRLELPPLAAADAEELLEAAIERDRLERLELSDFRKAILEASRGLPGAILKMAAMAGEAKYQYGNRVKTKLIYTDYLIELASRVRE